MLRVALLGAGRIAQTMAMTLNAMEHVQAYAVASRELSRAEAFAEKWGCERAYGSYEEMLADPLVDLVYVATPHSHHYRCAKMSLQAGKHVLCEKAFTVNAEQARKLCDLAKEKKRLLAEAIWTRYMPSREMIQKILESGAIGEPVSLTVNLGYELGSSERMWRRDLAGGALLDLGVYVIHFARMIFGEKMTSLRATAVFRGECDMTDSISMVFDGNKMATAQVCAMAQMNRCGLICGSKGYMEVVNINNPQKIILYDSDHRMIKEYGVPEQITGYEYEVEACRQAILGGMTECWQIPHAETLRVMETMDLIRESWGYELPLLD